MTASETLMLLSDDALMARVARGDDAAFAALVTRHLPRHVALATRLLGSDRDAEDAVQDAFLQCWRHAPRFDPERAKLTTWLYRILINRCLDRKRKDRHAGLPLDAAGDPPDPAPRPDQAAAQASDARLVQAALDALPPRQRAAVMLVYYEGMSNREAAAVMALGVKGLESLLTRARAGLRAALGDSAMDLSSAPR